MLQHGTGVMIGLRAFPLRGRYVRSSASLQPPRPINWPPGAGCAAAPSANANIIYSSVLDLQFTTVVQ